MRHEKVKPAGNFLDALVAKSGPLWEPRKRKSGFRMTRVCEKQGACLYPLDIMDMTRPGYRSVCSEP